MASQITNYQCPACSGPLHFGTSSGKLECDYCGSKYEVAEIEARLKEQNERAAAAMAEQEAKQKAAAMEAERLGAEWNMDALSDEWGSDSANMKSYECPACGAELICDETTAATCCPYCGNQTIVPGQFAGALKPEYVIPFKTDKERAKAALLEHYKGKRLLPKSFVAGNHIEDIQGVYVPFWLFDCEASGRMEFDATTSKTETQGNKETTTTKHYDVRRSGTLTFEKVPVDASTKMPDGHMDSIEPYDYRELKPFSMAYMPGFLADKYDVEAAECGRRMEERCRKTFEDELTKTVTGYDRQTVKSRSVNVKKGAVHYALMPVWLLATKWDGQNFLFAMNGQSGKLVGDLPLDKGKYWGYFGGISALLILLLQLINFLVFEAPATGLENILLCILFPIVTAFLIVSAMKAKLKSVTAQRAGAYIAGKGLVLAQKTDHYIKTTTETRVIRKAD